jgi:hypothetical protein
MSPSFRKDPFLNPTPSGVPLKIMSPTASEAIDEMHEISVGTSKIMFDVRSF